MTNKEAVSKKNYKKKPNGKNDTGSPTKYKESYCKEIVDYFLKCKREILLDITYHYPKKVEDQIMSEEGKTRGPVKWEYQKLIMQLFPTFQRYAVMIDMDEDTMLAREKNYPKFLGARKKCKAIQEAILIENGLQWTYNSTFAMFLLKNNFGYKDKTETEVKATIEVNDITEKQKKAIDSLRIVGFKS